jgi:hypothetical protein
VGLQALENTALSWGIIGKLAPILAEIAIRKSQELSLEGVFIEGDGGQGTFDDFRIRDVICFFKQEVM